MSVLALVVVVVVVVVRLAEKDKTRKETNYDIKVYDKYDGKMIVIFYITVINMSSTAHCVTGTDGRCFGV